MKFKKIIPAVIIMIVMVGIISLLFSFKVYASEDENYFEKSIVGATGWSTCSQNAKEQPNANSKNLFTVEPGNAFCILSEVGNYWCIKYGQDIGFIEHKWCFINLPDVIPSIEYNITNAYSSIYRSSLQDIPELTGEQLYDLGKTYNPRLGYDEFAVPMLYSTSKIVAKAQYIAHSFNYSLMICDAYRPKSVTTLAAEKLSVLYNSNEEVKKNINTLVDDEKSYGWGQSWFLAQGTSTHNTGAALDVTLVDIETREEIPMQSPMHELSTFSCKYTSGSSKTFVSTMTEDAINLDLIFTEAGMTGLASEWWHFQDNAGYSRILGKTGGCTFQIEGIASEKEYMAYYYLSHALDKNIEVCKGYRIYRPNEAESKPLMVFIPGMGGGIDGSYNITGLYQYIQDGTVVPDCTVVFFYRDGYNGKIKSSYVKEVVDSLPHTDLYYCGFSLGAWDFHKYLDVGDFKKAILIDGFDLEFDTETSLEEVYVVQSYEHYVDQYNQTLYGMYENNPDLDYQVIDLTDNRAHVECGWWLFAPTDAEYFKYKDVDFDYPVFDIMSII